MANPSAGVWGAKRAMEPTVLLSAVASAYIVMCGVLLTIYMVVAADAAAGAPGRGATGRRRAARDPMKMWSRSRVKYQSRLQ